MSTVSLAEAQAHLPELIEKLKPGDELIITQGLQPIARLTGATAIIPPPRKLGSMRGSVVSMAPDFDAPPAEFQEYIG